MALRTTSPKDPVAAMTSRTAAQVARLRAQADHLEAVAARIQSGNAWQDAAKFTPVAGVTYVGRLASPLGPRLSDNPSEQKARIGYSAPGLFCWAPGLGWLYAAPRAVLDTSSDVSLQLWVPEPVLAAAAA